MNRPKSVDHAAIAIYITLLIAACSSLVKRWTEQVSLGQFFLELIVYGLLCIVPYKVGTGSNPARYFFLITSILSVVFVLGGGYSEMAIADFVGGGISLPLEIVAIYKLFFTDASTWFQSTRNLDVSGT